MIKILLFVFLLSALIAIHEAGHMLAAKIFGVYVTEYSIGMGPAIFQHQFKETMFSIRCLPLGGYCALAGDEEQSKLEEHTEVNVPFERTLKGVSKLKKVIIMLAGVTMNMLLAIFIVAMVYLASGTIGLSPSSQIKEATINMPAYNAGIRDNDKIVYMELENGTSSEIDLFSDISYILDQYKSGSIYIEVERNNEKLSFNVTPAYNQDESRYVIGVTSGSYTVVNVNLLNCWKYSVEYCIDTTVLMVNVVGQLFRGIGLENVSGVVGIYQSVSETVELGMSYYFLLMAIISINLAIMNLLPLPVLDGGRILLVVVEAIVGHPLNKKFEGIIMLVSTILLIALTIIITFKDIFNLVK